MHKAQPRDHYDISTMGGAKLAPPLEHFYHRDVSGREREPQMMRDQAFEVDVHFCFMHCWSRAAPHKGDNLMSGSSAAGREQLLG